VIVASEGEFAFPPLRTLVERQQELVNLIYEAGDIPRRLDARKEFDLRFDEVIRSKLN
jgi:sulfonate transport system substrate-binding protein